MKFNIPERLHIRWQAALAVLEDLQEDSNAPFSMSEFADRLTIWERTNGCRSAACFAGYLSVAPYCRDLGYPKNDYGVTAESWLLGNVNIRAPASVQLYDTLFAAELSLRTRAKTLAFLEQRIKTIFKDSTGKKLVAPLTFYY